MKERFCKYFVDTLDAVHQSARVRGFDERPLVSDTRIKPLPTPSYRVPFPLSRNPSAFLAKARRAALLKSCYLFLAWPTTQLTADQPWDIAKHRWIVGAALLGMADKNGDQLATDSENYPDLVQPELAMAELFCTRVLLQKVNDWTVDLAGDYLLWGAVLAITRHPDLNFVHETIASLSDNEYSYEHL